MQAILGLVKYPTGRAFDRAGADLFAPVGRQAVQHDGAAVGFGQESLIQAPAGKGLFPFQLFLLLAHRSPDIGIEGMGSAHRGDRVVHHFDAAAGWSEGPGLLHQLPNRLEAPGAADAHVYPE